MAGEIPYLDLTIDGGLKVEVVISHVETPSLVWLQLSTNTAADITAELNRANLIALESCEERQYCVAPYEFIGENRFEWRRVQIICVARDHEIEVAKVIYIDFGLVLWLSSKLLRKLPEKLMYYSRQAISCRLKDLVPLNHRKWSHTCIETLKKTSMVEGLFKADLIDKDTHQYIIDLYFPDNSNTNGANICYVLELVKVAIITKTTRGYDAESPIKQAYLSKTPPAEYKLWQLGLGNSLGFAIVPIGQSQVTQIPSGPMIDTQQLSTAGKISTDSVSAEVMVQETWLNETEFLPAEVLKFPKPQSGRPITPAPENNLALSHGDYKEWYESTGVRNQKLLTSSLASRRASWTSPNFTFVGSPRFDDWVLKPDPLKNRQLRKLPVSAAKLTESADFFADFLMVDWGVIQSGGNRKLPVALHYQLQLQWPIDLDCPSGDKCARHWCFLCQPSRPRADKSADLANHKLSALVQHLIESQSHQKNLAKKWRSPAINPCGKVWIESMKVAFCAWKSSAQLPHQKWPAAADFIFYTNSSPKATCHIQVTNVTDRQQRLRFEGSNTSSQKFGSYQIRKDKVQLYHSEGDRVHLDWVLEPRGKLQLELRLKFQPNWLNHVTIALLFLVAEDTGADQILDDNFKLIRAEPKTVLIKFI